MPSRLRRAAAAAAALAGLLAAPAGTAVAQSEGDGGFFLTVSGARDTWIRGVQLHCPAGAGNHQNGAAACAGLAAAGGDFDALPGDPHVCTREYHPVTATAVGTWGGRAVSWQRTFPNACALDTSTGAVFRF